MLLGVTPVPVKMTVAHARMIALVKMIIRARIAHVRTTTMMIVRTIRDVTVMMTVRIILAVMMMIAKTTVSMVAVVARIASPHLMSTLPVRSATFMATPLVTAGGAMVMTVLHKVTVGTGGLTLPLTVLTPIGTMTQVLLITSLAS
jgi:hypothetical protein